MMACIADNVIAAPFALLGSIDVVAQLPNFQIFRKMTSIMNSSPLVSTRRLLFLERILKKGREKFVES